MRIGIVAFTAQGSRTALLLARGLTVYGHQTFGFVTENCYLRLREEWGESVRELRPLTGSLREWTGEFFERGSALIFVGATGIAVRSIAPFLKGKDSDPAVVAVDEKGMFAISLLSGHLGGANALARLAASVLGAMPVITTATDLNHTFAVDLFARDNDLAVTDLTAAKEISAELLRDGKIGFFSDLPVDGEIPAGIVPGQWQARNIVISVRREAAAGKRRPGADRRDYLLLVPRVVTLGIGCRRGIQEEAIARTAGRVMEGGNIHPLSVARVASVDRKRNEAGLLDFAKLRELPVSFYSAEELERLTGEFSESEFVSRTVGVGNVCERAAVLGCAPHPGRLIVKKTVLDGVAAAAAAADRRLHFAKPGEDGGNVSGGEKIHRWM